MDFELRLVNGELKLVPINRNIDMNQALTDDLKELHERIKKQNGKRN